jgi:hypothetical protein
VKHAGERRCAPGLPGPPTARTRRAQVASAAHVEVMRKCRPGLMEYALEAVFLRDCYLLGGCRHAPYTPICASGPNGAVLHYGHAAAPNSARPASVSRARAPAQTCRACACVLCSVRPATPACDSHIGCECGWTAGPVAAAF